MRYTLTTSPDGSMSIASDRSVRPPLGLVLPAGQDVRHEATSAVALESLITSASPSLEGLQIHTASKQYLRSGSEWLDMASELPAGSDEISGMVTFRNPAAYDIGITW